MAKFRNKIREKFSQIPNQLIFDNSLSDRARFVYCFMASKPEDWEFYLSPMAEELGYTVATLRKYIKELCVSGWLTKGNQSYNHDGTFGAFEYTLEDIQVEIKELENSPGYKKTATVKNRRGKIITHNNIISNTNKKNNNNKLLLEKKSEISTTLLDPPTKRFTKPTLKDILEYCKSRNNSIDPESFLDHYEANGWVVGKTKMKCWRAAVRQWERRNFSSPTSPKQRVTNMSPITQTSESYYDTVIRLAENRTAERRAKAIEESTLL